MSEPDAKAPRAPILRVARPTNDLDRLLPFYVDGLGFEVIGRFSDHQGFDGLILGLAHASYHLEFTRQHGVTVASAPSPEHLLVLYLPDERLFSEAVLRMKRAGFGAHASANPYWDVAGATFQDPDGYRVVLQHAAWRPFAQTSKETP